jgi:hypothetical protein
MTDGPAEQAASDLPDIRRLWRRLPAGIWALGFVSLLMDVSSEMIHALLPVYLVVGLGATALTVGIIEGSPRRRPRSPRCFPARSATGSANARNWRPRLWAGRPDQAGLSAGAQRSAGWSPRASSTGSARASVARRATRWWPTSRRPSYAGRLRAAAVAGYGRGLHRTAAGHRADVAIRRRFLLGLLGGGDPGLRGAGTDPVRRARASAPGRAAKGQEPAQPARTRWARRGSTGGSSRWRRCSRWHGSARRS